MRYEIHGFLKPVDTKPADNVGPYLLYLFMKVISCFSFITEISIVGLGIPDNYPGKYLGLQQNCVSSHHVL